MYAYNHAMQSQTAANAHARCARIRQIITNVMRNGAIITHKRTNACTRTLRQSCARVQTIITTGTRARAGAQIRRNANDDDGGKRLAAIRRRCNALRRRAHGAAANARRCTACAIARQTAAMCMAAGARRGKCTAAAIRRRRRYGDGGNTEMRANGSGGANGRAGANGRRRADGGDDDMMRLRMTATAMLCNTAARQTANGTAIRLQYGN